MRLFILLSIPGSILALAGLAPVPEFPLENVLAWIALAFVAIGINLILLLRWAEQGRPVVTSPEAKRISWWILVLACPLIEELIFRGGLLRLGTLALGPTLALLVSSIGFAVGHQRPKTLGDDFGHGVLYGLLAIHVGLWAAVLAHASWNAFVMRCWACAKKET